MTVEIRMTGDVDAYAAAVRGFLAAQPCERNLLSTVLEAVRAGALAAQPPPTFWWLSDAGEVVGAASWTPPYNILVSDLDGGGADLLATSAEQRWHEAGVRPNGVTGPVETAQAVARAWCALTGDASTVRMTELLHQLEQLTEPAAPSGAWRLATGDDVDLVAGWFVDFAAEAGLTAAPDPRRHAMIATGHDRCGLWVDGGQPVSMVCRNPQVAGVVRIGPVYTPPPFRNRGYAQRLTYEVTRDSLHRGAQMVTLYTDVANPTSNSIYRKLGFRPIARVVEIAFAPMGVLGSR